MIYKPNFEESKVYWRAFWEREVIDRPLLCVTAPKDGVRPPSAAFTPSICFQHCMDGTFDTLLKKYDARAAAMYYGGEAIPQFEITLGPDQYAAFLGAPLLTNDETYTTWAHPIVDDWETFEVAIDKSPGGYYDQIEKFFERGAELMQDRFLLATLDMHSHMDALSALRGPMGLCYDVMDCPEKVHKILDAVRKTYPDIFNMTRDAGKMERSGYTCWAPLYSEESYSVVSCDFACMLSPEQTREFVIPAVEEEAAFLTNSLYHIDGAGALKNLDDILAIERIGAIQWVPGAGQPRTLQWMDVLHKIQDAGKGLWIYDWSIDEIKAHFRDLKPEGLVFTIGCRSQKEADDLIRYVKTHM